MTASRVIPVKLVPQPSTVRQPRYEIPFVLPGTCSGIAITSPPWSPRESITLTAVRVLLGDAGYASGSPVNVIGSVNVNNTPVTLLLASGSASTSFSLRQSNTGIPDPDPRTFIAAVHQHISPTDIVTVQLTLPRVAGPIRLSLGSGAGRSRPATDLTVHLDFG